MSAEEGARPTAIEIHEEAVRSGRLELDRSAPQLAFSALSGGLAIGLSALGVAAVRWKFGYTPQADLLAALVYPLGFVAVIVGRAQLFTENTLYPVLVVLDKPAKGMSLLKLWGVVLLGNLGGAVLFGLLTAKTAALRPEMRDALVHVGVEAARQGTGTLFWSAVVAGWIIALVAWTVTASHYTSGHVLMIVALTFIIGLGHFAHSIAGSAEALASVFAGALGVGEYLRWLALVVGGNVVGGVTMVSLINYGQVRS